MTGDDSEGLYQLLALVALKLLKYKSFYPTCNYLATYIQNYDKVQLYDAGILA